MNLTNPIFTDADKAREHLEAVQWPNGPVCPHCGNVDAARITKLQGKSTRPGVYKCKECSKPFTVTVGTVFERSHIPLNLWLLASALMASSKVPEGDLRKVASAFVDMYQDPKGRDILHQASKEVGLPNDAYFVSASGADYAAYKRFYQSAPVSLH